MVVTASAAVLFVSLLAYWPMFAQGHLPFWEPARCPFPVPESEVEGETLACGYLHTAENRRSQNPSKIQLAAAILHSTGSSPAPDPIIYLEGGPGGSAISGIDDWLHTPLRDRRDIILLDQRGTGYSAPFLGCKDSAAVCRQRFTERGIDLSNYNSAASAYDLVELRAALGISQWNVVGISYGTRLALTLLRDHPQGVRSVVLDSVYPPQARAYEQYPANALRAFDTLFAACAADRLCSRAYPDLGAVFYRLVNALNFSPVSIDNGYEENEWDFNGDDLVDTLYDALYDTGLIPYLPWAIYEFYQGNANTGYALMTGIAFRGYDEEGSAAPSDEPDFSQSDGVFYSVECTEELPFNDQDAALKSLNRLPGALRRAFVLDLQDAFQTCKNWPVDPAHPLETLPVTSKIPALVLAGHFDPITPPQWAEQTAAFLSRSFYVLFPNAGHGILGTSRCADSLYMQFLDDPTTAPDTSCLNDLPVRFKIR